MSRTKKTPVLQVKGRFTLIAPWSTNPASLYTCVAIRGFDDVYKVGKDVYKTFYEPMGVINGQAIPNTSEIFNFEDEVTAKVNIITLLADDGTPLYVPDTFIANYPDLSEVPYSHLILSFSIGAIPDYVQLGALMTELANTVAQQLGKAPEVNVHRIPSDINPTQSEHDALEVARVASITLLENDKAKSVRLTEENTRLKEQNTSLIAILQSKGDLPS